jgi:hypothetical protein
VSIKWTKSSEDAWTAAMGPFRLVLQGKADGRWSWQIFNGDVPNPTATGLATSLGAAKNVTEQFVKRSGLV